MEDLLESTFAWVPKMLSGKKCPKNVRALRIVTEELLWMIFVNEIVQSYGDL